MKKAPRLVGAAVIALLVQAGAAGTQDSLATARQLYASASYDEALAMLDRLKSSGASDPAAASLIAQYRAFCLLAVGHQPDAERAMESLVAGDPTFRPDDAISPRLQSVFRDARKRTLPGVIRQRYASAKASFDEKAYQAAADQFDAVLRLLEAPDVVAIKQNLPPWPQGIPKMTVRGRRAVLDIAINEAGNVESVIVRESIVDWYDEALIKEAKGWSYKPASKEGAPVKYRKLMQVVVEK
jgi:TonB family protein